MQFKTRHAYPLLLVDRVTEKNPENVKAIKNVSFNDKIFLGHFPDQPIYPAIYIVEGLCQCAQLILGVEVAVTAKLDKFKFIKKVVPGDQLVFEVERSNQMGPFQTVIAKALVQGEIVAKGEIVGCAL